MWYRFSKEKFKYKSILRQNVLPFADEEGSDQLAEINVSENPDLIPQDLQPDASNQNILEPETEVGENEEAPLLIDKIDPPVQSDTIDKQNNLAPPKAPHDGCRCENRIRQKISGGYEWKVDSGMCPDCQQAAREYNKMIMDLSGVNDPIDL